MFYRALILSWAFLAWGGSAAQAQPPKYTAIPVRDTAALNDMFLLERFALNNRNQVLGRTNYISLGGVWTDGSVRTLPPPPQHSGIFYLGLNDLGLVLSSGEDAARVRTGWLTDSLGTIIHLSSPSPRMDVSGVLRLDQSGRTLGTAMDTVRHSNGGTFLRPRATLWSRTGTGSFLGLPEDLRDSIDILSLVTTVGMAISDGGYPAILATGLTGSPATQVRRVYVDLGSGWTHLVPDSGREFIGVGAVSNAGHVAGSMGYQLGWGSGTVAYLWQGGQFTSLHRHSYTLSVASDVNSQGHVVGTYYDQVYQGNHPITVPKSGFLYLDGETYLLSELLAGGLTGVSTAVAINEAGVILVGAGNNMEQTWLLVPELPSADSSRHVVNSTGDTGDDDLEDGVCHTGQFVLGEEECTLRAALQQSNHTPDRDTILFALEDSGRVIRPESPLPNITGPLRLDGTSVGGMMVLDGSHPGFGDSLVVADSGCEISHVCFQGFVQPALALAGEGHHTVRGCEFGHSPAQGGKRNESVGLVVHSRFNTIGGRQPGEGNLIHFNDLGGLELRSDSNTVWGNRIEWNGYATEGGALLNDLAHGVEIFGSYNQLGDYFWAEAADTITRNAGAGVFVASGTGNDFRNNRIFGNHGLGIDLAPLGVNAIDSLDGDTGPNHATNAPRIDSIRTNGVLTAYGSMLGEPAYGYVLEFFESDSCDCEGFGEGQRSLGTTQVVANAHGKATFSIEMLDTSKVMSLTATRDDRSTSEFSVCFVKKQVELVDHEGDRLANHRFAMSRQTGGQFELIDSVDTDDSARVDLRPLILSGRLDYGDTLAFRKHVHSEPNRKGSHHLFDTRYEVTLDNMRINDTTSAISYDTIGGAPVQRVTLGHGLLSYNLLMSVEWDEAFSYYGSQVYDLANLLSTYLYDVYDGCVNLKTLHVAMDSRFWDVADIRVYASNNKLPWASPIASQEPGLAISFPRRWFGKGVSAPDRSAQENPSNITDPLHYQMLGKMLGTYLHGLVDESYYDASCPGHPNIGMMDDPSPAGGEGASELSWSRQHESFCEDNTQWGSANGPSWDLLERGYEKTYGSFDIPIVQPKERNLPAANDWLLGPWKPQSASAYVHFGARRASDRLFKVGSQIRRPLSAAYVAITLRKSSPPHREIEQGATSSEGDIWVVGGQAGDSVYMGARDAAAALALAASSAPGYTWSYGSTEITAADTQHVTLVPVYGNYPLVAQVKRQGDAVWLGLAGSTPFSQAPSVTYSDSTGQLLTRPLSATGAGFYEGVLSDAAAQFTAYVTATDDSSHNFFFPLHVSEVVLDSTELVWHGTNATGDLRFLIDTTGNDVQRVLMASTAYPPPASGTLAGSVQAGRVHAIDFGPQTSLGGTPHVGIAYSDSELFVPGAAHTLEASLRVYAWDEAALTWQRVGGFVDTVANVVWTHLPGPGTYAVFSQDQLASVNEPRTGTVPEGYFYAQNYPNPFNPATTIAFTLPASSRVTLEVLNILGQRVRRLLDDRPLSAGSHSVVWNGRTDSGTPVASGPYLYRIEAGADTQVRKMLLLK